MKVFISYSRWNRTFAEQLARDLARAGADVWQDVFSIRTDTEWLPAILKGIEESDCFVLLASPESAKSEYVASELEEARRLGRKVLTLWIAGKEAQLPPDWRARQMIEARSYWAALPKILSELGITATIATLESLINGTRTFGDLAQAVGGAKPFGELIAVPVVPGPYGTGYFAGPPAEIVPAIGTQRLPPVALMLRFTGPEIDDTLTEAARFVKGQGRVPWFLYVEGPLAGGRFTIPENSAHVWAECANLCGETVRLWAKGRHESLDIFVNAPAALAFIVGARLREMIGYRLYNFNRAGKSIYELVFESGWIA